MLCWAAVKRTRAFAFLALLFLTLVLFMVCLAVVARTRTGANFQLEGQKDIAALYAAEAGVAEALARWSEDATKSWAPAVYQRTLQDGEGSFEIRFDAAHSRNNLNNPAAADGPRGPASVPGLTALLIVTGRAQGKERTLEVLVGRSGLISSPAALLGQRAVHLAGNVTVTGVRSMQDRSEVPADLVVLNSEDSAGHATWDGAGELNVSGAITSNSGNSAAISPAFGSGNVSNGVLPEQSRTAPATVDISARVSSAFSEPHNTPVLSGPATTLSAGNHCLSNPVIYDGDLVLDGANLYVNGDLHLNGSIKGTGSVFVTGDTVVQGTTTIQASDQAGVALFSRGDVELTGFNGSQYLETFMARAGSNGVPYSEHLQNFKHWSREMLQAARDGNAAPATLPGKVGQSRFGNDVTIQTGWTNMSDFDTYYGALCVDVGDNYAGLATTQANDNPIRNLTIALSQGSSPPETQQFLLEKFRELRPVDPNITVALQQVMAPNSHKGFFGPRKDVGADCALRTNNVLAGSDDSLFDHANDTYNNTTFMPTDRRAALHSKIVNVLEMMDFDHPGMAYFQGVVYTQGNLRASNELRLVGGLFAVGPNSRIQLENGVWVTYVPELVQQAGNSLGLVGVRQWLRR
jgi:hypothetical protein